MIKLICCSHEKCKTSFKPKASVKKMDRVIKCNRKDWLKPYIDTNRNLRKKKVISKKTMENRQILNL